MSWLVVGSASPQIDCIHGSCWAFDCFVTNQNVTTSLPRHILIIAMLAGIFFVTFLCPTWQLHSQLWHKFYDVFQLGSDKNQASQISDTIRIVTKFVTKKYVFVTEYILWLTLGVDRIFVTRTSQNANYNENNHFCNINRTSPNVKSLVVKV